MSVVSIQAVLGADPNEPITILQHGEDHVLGQTIVDGQRPSFEDRGGKTGDSLTWDPIRGQEMEAEQQQQGVDAHSGQERTLFSKTEPDLSRTNGKIQVDFSHPANIEIGRQLKFTQKPPAKRAIPFVRVGTRIVEFLIMLPLPFSISPLLLSIFLIYPWALALGVWQIGKLTNRAPGASQATVREYEQETEGDSFTSGGLAKVVLTWTSAALPPSPFDAVRDLSLVGTVAFPRDADLPNSPTRAHRIPRAPPALA